MKRRTCLLACLAAGAAMVPISASADVESHTLTASGSFQGQTLGNTLEETFVCYAAATPDAVSVTITSCTLHNSVTSASATTAAGGPGAATAAGTGTFNAADGSLQLCWTATATFPETTLGPSTLTTSGCTG